MFDGGFQHGRPILPLRLKRVGHIRTIWPSGEGNLLKVTIAEASARATIDKMTDALRSVVARSANPRSHRKRAKF